MNKIILFTTILSVAVGVTITHIAYAYNIPQQDLPSHSIMYDEQENIIASQKSQKSGSPNYENIEIDKISLSENTFFE